MNKKLCEQHSGQGLVEYALLLVFVGIVVLAILSLLGPQIGNVFSQVVEGFGGGQTNVVAAPLARVTNASMLPRVGNVVTLNVTVSKNTTITLSDSQGGGSASSTCNGGCTPNITVGGSGSGNITVSAPGNSLTVFYSPAP